MMNGAPGVAAASETETVAVTGGRRLVFFLPGHDATDMDYHYGRFVNQAGRFGALWGIDVEVSPRLDEDGTPTARWEVTSQAPNWRMATDYRILRWDDIIVELDERPDPVRLWGGFVGLWDVLASGTAWRYFKASPRYGFFFFFPIAITALFAAIGALAGWFAAWLVSETLPAPIPLLLGVAVGIGVFFALFRHPGRKWRLHQALDDWDLAHNYLHDRTPSVDERLDTFADLLVAAVREGRHDEVVLVGHSLGATFLLGTLHRALDRAPDIATSRVRLRVLTVGATIPKLALHPKGRKVREAARRIATTPGIEWCEFQARHDAINFYKFHPVTLARAEFDEPGFAASGIQPMLRNANIKRMLTPEKLRKLRWQIMRIHYQFLLANERPASYDYFMFALGPLPFTELASRLDGPIGRFGPDGALLDLDTERQ